VSRLLVTVIDVGWGDSLFLESVDTEGCSHFGLVDSNDTTTLRSTHIYLKRFFERKGVSMGSGQTPVFDWMLLTHAHADHGQGLKRIMRDFGTRQFWYPKSASHALFFSDLLRYAQRSRRVVHHQAVYVSKKLRTFGDAAMDILWPPDGLFPENENNNSVVVALTLGDVSMVLTGDLEADVWTQIAEKVPDNTLFFKVPHHGSDNGLFDGSRTPWLDRLGADARLAISSHVRPFEHPHSTVISELDSRNMQYYRTDEQYHLEFETDGQQLQVKYSHR